MPEDTRSFQEASPPDRWPSARGGWGTGASGEVVWVTFDPEQPGRQTEPARGSPSLRALAGPTL